MSEHPTMLEATRVWWRIGILSFGGPAAQISLMHREVVDERHWLNEKQFLNALSFCMLLPGPEAMQLATYTGWRIHGVMGGLIAGLLFVIPGALIIMLLATLYAFYGDLPLVSALFYGIKVAVLVIVLEALIKVSMRALNGFSHWVIACLAFIGLFFFAVPFPLIIMLAAFYGFFTTVTSRQVTKPENSGVALQTTFKTILTWGLIWLLPFGLLALFGGNALLQQVAIFFSTLAVVTFGGAYAVLAYMAQDVVTQFGWLSAQEMIDALGLAETTPGPLILVTQFVGFLAGFKEGGLLLAIAASFVTLWVTFAPCFLWIFAGAPYLEWVSDQPRLKGALSAITAAVVGVILNLSIWFALHVLFADVQKFEWGLVQVWSPVWWAIEWLALLLFAMSALLVFKMHFGIIRVLLLMSLLGAALRYAFVI